MISLFLRIFLRYRHEHLKLPIAPVVLSAADGEPSGFLDLLYKHKGITRIQGWIGIGSLVLLSSEGATTIDAQLERKDACAATGNDDARGFCVEVGCHQKLAIQINGSTQPHLVNIPKVGYFSIVRAEMGIVVSYVSILLANYSLFLSWLKHPDFGKRAEISRRLGFKSDPTTGVVDRSVFDAPNPSELRTRYFIIIPVFNAPEVLSETLRRVAENSAGDWHAIVVDDASDSPKVRPILRKFFSENPNRVSHLENRKNIGFVGSVNRALTLTHERNWPVVLLNSDAWVPDGWDERLLTPLSDPEIASVTPMSNNAELCTVPNACCPVALDVGIALEIDQRARQLNGRHLTTIPTGVGFCMALSAQWLKKCPDFDPIFGRGYGEEVDWCLRTRNLGARHVLQHRLFVEHVGSASFGQSMRNECTTKSCEIISRRYPNFDHEVQNYLASDPAATARMALAIAWAKSQVSSSVPVFLGHSMGGGAEIVLQREIDTEISRAGSVLVLRVGGMFRWTVELHFKDAVTKISTNESDEVLTLLGDLGDSRIIYSCGVGDPEPLELPEFLVFLAGEGSLEIRIHDYFTCSPSVFLTDENGRYLGNPAPQTGAVKQAEWHREWNKLYHRADLVTVFSKDSAIRIAETYPCSLQKIQLSPHQGARLPGRARHLPHTAPASIGVLGNLSVAKGAGVLGDLAMSDPGLNFVALGRIDPAISVPNSVHVIGGYAIDQIDHLVQKHGISAWLVPSVCPETYSFTTHESLATGLPVVGFDLGAQGETLKFRENGQVVSLVDGYPDTEATTALLRQLVGQDSAFQTSVAA